MLIERKFVTLGVYWFLALVMAGMSGDGDTSVYLAALLAFASTVLHVYFPIAYHRYYTGTDEPITSTTVFRLFALMLAILAATYVQLLSKHVDAKRDMENGIIPLPDSNALPNTFFVVVFGLYVFSCWRVAASKGSGLNRFFHALGVFYWPIGLIFMKRRS